MTVRILTGDAAATLATMPAESVQCCITSPPYWGLRDYGVEGQIGLEETPAQYVAHLVEVFRQVRRVLRKDGTLWLNLGDTYAGGRKGYGQTCSRRRDRQGVPRGDRLVEGLKRKDLLGIPWRVAFALQAEGWWLREDIIWRKTNAMPENVTDRPDREHEYLFLLTKSEKYQYTKVADGRRSVWAVANQGFSEAHFATFPPGLVEPCIRASCNSGGTILDPFSGAGTTGLVADRMGLDAVLIDLNPQYAEMARRRIRDDNPMFAQVE